MELEDIVKTLSNSELRTLTALQATTLFRRLLMTEQVYIGMAPTEARKRDSVCLWLLGCRVPVLLRKREEGGYELIGDVYIHGIMDRQTLSEESCRKLEDFDIMHLDHSHIRMNLRLQYTHSP